MRATVSDRQSVFDVAMERFGSAEAAYDIALANSIGITDTVGGSELELPDAEKDTITVTWFRETGMRPATETEVRAEEPGTGLYVHGPISIGCSGIYPYSAGVDPSMEEGSVLLFSLQSGRPDIFISEDGEGNSEAYNSDENLVAVMDKVSGELNVVLATDCPINVCVQCLVGEVVRDTVFLRVQIFQA